MDWRERITIDPNIAVGKPTVQGTRIAVSFVLYLMAGGSTENDIVKYYPQLKVEDIRACCLYASENLPRQKPHWYGGNDFLESDEWEVVAERKLPAQEIVTQQG